MALLVLLLGLDVLDDNDCGDGGGRELRLLSPLERREDDPRLPLLVVLSDMLLGNQLRWNEGIWAS